ncbi:hypothetical protein HDU76_003054 [Blyttiomyces sp. JEL0837]|nr:hypothetical protein HDU76_003054 [Blyttiomyces sp. JEL0837]
MPTSHHPASTSLPGRGTHRWLQNNGTTGCPQRRWSQLPTETVKSTSHILDFHDDETEQVKNGTTTPSTSSSSSSVVPSPNSGSASLVTRKSSKNSFVSFSDIVSVAEIARGRASQEVAHTGTVPLETETLKISKQTARVQRRRSTADVESGIKRRSSGASSRPRRRLNSDTQQISGNNLFDKSNSLFESIDDYTNKEGFMPNDGQKPTPNGTFKSHKDSKTTVTLCSEEVVASAQVNRPVEPGPLNDSAMKEEKKQVFGRLKEWLRQITVLKKKT